MKKMHWLLIIVSAVLYALPFLFDDYVWWLVFIFPVPLLYAACIKKLSFIDGFIWGCVTFLLHLSGGIYVFMSMAHEYWIISIIFGMAVVLYQAFFCGIFFECAALSIRVFSIHSLFQQLLIWVTMLWILIRWVDGYSLWIFGVQEGYPLMHPLILLVKKPELLWLLPIIGKQLLTILFLLISVCMVSLIFYKTYKALLFFCFVAGIWMLCLCMPQGCVKKVLWQIRIKSLPFMMCSTVEDPSVIIKVIGNQIKKIITKYPDADIIIMPESACNIDNFADLSDVLSLWNEQNIGKSIYIIFGASRQDKGNYYNALHWVYNGVLQNCHDKRHGMLISERLPLWMDTDFVRTIFFNMTPPITTSLCLRKKICMFDMNCVPYICSELFFNEFPDDEYDDVPVIAVVNDSVFLGSIYSAYIQKLLFLLAQCRAIQWQREIVYVSYAQSSFIDKYGRYKPINE